MIGGIVMVAIDGREYRKRCDGSDVEVDGDKGSVRVAITPQGVSVRGRFIGYAVSFSRIASTRATASVASSSRDVARSTATLPSSTSTSSG
jgi:hypothetical protein